MRNCKNTSGKISGRIDENKPLLFDVIFVFDSNNHRIMFLCTGAGTIPSSIFYVDFETKNH